MTVENEKAYSLISDAPLSERKKFLFKSYLHLLGAILLFIALHFFFYTTGITQYLLNKFAGMNWLIILGAFMLVSWFATNLAHKSQSKVSQYFSLFLYVLIEAIIFILPIGYLIASGNIETLKTASLMTLFLFSVLTLATFYTKQDFSFLRSILTWGGIIALVLIIGSVILGYNLGFYFTIAMIAFSGGAILYTTSSIMNTYPPDRYIAASLELFASIALLFWYLLRFYSRD